MGLTLTDEQHAFTEAVRELARRECGTREQRDALTDHGAHAHNAAETIVGGTSEIQREVIAMTY